RLNHVGDAPHTKAAGGDLRKIVSAPFFRHSRVEQQQLENIGLQLAPAKKAYHGDAGALLVDLGSTGHAARRDAADVGVMGDVAHEADKLVSREYRHGHVDVRQVRAPCL